MNVSVLILTLNEERNLPRCLDALGWCDDIVVVDSGSTDRTREIALERGVRVLTRPFDNFANQRNFGLEVGELRHEWVLHLDADEVLTPSFIHELMELQPPPGVHGYKVPSKLMLVDRWLKHAGMYPAYQVRLGKRETLRFRQVGHGQREALEPAQVATFHQPYLHYCFSGGLKAWLAKHVRYAADEAALIAATHDSPPLGGLFDGDPTERRRALKAVVGRMPPILRPFARFFYVLFVRRGFLDGAGGVLYALMLSVYEGMITILLYERRFELGRSR